MMSNGIDSFRKMEYYTERSCNTNYIDIADKCTEGIFLLWDNYYFNSSACEGNLFMHKFTGEDIILKKEYLFAMDYLTYVLTAYKKTKKEVYKNTFIKIINQFYEYINLCGPIYDDLPVYAQTLLFIKAIDILGELPHQATLLELLEKYASWLMDDNNYQFDNNHGLFEDLALLHISILLDNHPEAMKWKEHAVRRTNALFSVAYYNDCTNNEHSINYFQHNNTMYQYIISFCKYYGISGVEMMESKLEKSKTTLITFAHQDCSFPIIGDGHVFFGKESNLCSQLFPDIGIALVKIEHIYMSFKGKTVFQAHAHTDISSITARYKNIDFIIDPGQYNYDRFTPINRFLRSAAGHSGIFPLFADKMFQKDFCETVSFSDITAYDHNDKNAFVKGEYRLKGVHVCREINVSANEILIRDSWNSEKPVTMRQRFVIPGKLLKHSRFSVAERTLESEVNDVKFQFEISTSLFGAITEVQFGVAAPQYNEFETTMLLDTFAENTVSGEITARISFMERINHEQTEMYANC